jgi:acetyl-CoA carboxylase carboxyl transferase subunit beta
MHTVTVRPKPAKVNRSAGSVSRYPTLAGCAVPAAFRSIRSGIAPGEESTPAAPAAVVNCAGAVVRDRAGRVLLIKRGHEPARGRWSLPGGRLEPGETSAEAAAREVREETGLIVAVGELLATVDLGHYVVDDFAATVVGGELRPGDDADDVRWCTAADLEELPLTDGLTEWLRRMGAL